MSLIHSPERKKKFFGHLNLVLERSLGMIHVVKSSEGGFLDNLGSEREVGGFVRVEFVQLLNSSGR